MRRRRFAGVLVLTALAAAACSGRPAAIRTVRIDIRNSHFNPSRVEVPAGSTVRFTVTNSDPIDHELIVGDEALQQREETGTDVIHNGDHPGMISVPAGATVSTVVPFPAKAQGPKAQGPKGPGAKGALMPFACHLPGHYAYGMRGVVVFT